MKFLLDVCVSSHSLTASLVAQGHDVLSALAVDPRARDERLMELALREERVLITEDKDYGELAFVHGLARLLLGGCFLSGRPLFGSILDVDTTLLERSRLLKLFLLFGS